MVKQISEFRKTSYNIDPIFLKRWSPRSFQEKEVPEDVLMSLFEAARWAPSASNEQPWRFVVARTKEEREKFFPFIMEVNRLWCEKAPVLAVILSKQANSKNEFNRTHAFDTGAAWGYLALEAANKGLITHAMGGFYKDKAREILSVPEEYDIHAVVAIGYQGNKEDLPEKFHEREKPSDRHEVKDFIFAGSFGKKADK
ncbi:nitroreductase family protein [Scopulibacillus cellulosilyticus]|uniref:Nitroreductase family protein n=1 Tax=Scopulibacillus cellulosilyticus TaxID=2665665 RepID=A0ABW2PZ29_9BACL